MTRTDPETEELERRLAALRDRLARLRQEIERRFLGQREVVDLLLFTLLGSGHALLEGAPGLGKTTLVKDLARALDLSFHRIQFTPDLMPADILGTRILDASELAGPRVRFERGPVFANFLLADEINRAAPRTQSALLEAMQEHQVTLFGETHVLEEPFFVVATQNPIEMEGTYPLPEAQLDRFLCKIAIDSPSEEELARILERTTGEPVPPIEPVLGREDVLEIRALVRAVLASSDVIQLVARLVRATDPRDPGSPPLVRSSLRYGASPRGGQAVLLLAKARALARNRPWVAEEDVEAVAVPALRHRLVLGYEGEARGSPADALVREALASARRG
jgi:MoxR-like ATPase